MQYPALWRTTILVVDDCQEAVDLLSLILESAGMRVLSACSGLEAIRSAFRHHPDALLLDIMMPEMDGFTVIKRVREMVEIPILIVSAKSSLDDITRAFELGADDYLAKPFERRELLARTDACIRRSQAMGRDDGILVLCRGDLIIDTYRHRVMVRQQEVKLTRTEFELLYYLGRNRDRVLTHAMILEAVWGYDANAGKDTLKQFMLTLRKKVESNPEQPEWLVTEHAIGYALVSEQG